MKPAGTDQELIERVGQGDERAFKTIYENYLWLRSAAVKRGSTPEAARDLYYDVMVILLVNITSGKLRTLNGKLSTYLYRLMENQRISEFRH